MVRPIIFIHYGHAGYLRYTMDCARLFNPEKRIILLGDDDNKYVKLFGIEHYQFKDFDYGPELKRFESLFRAIVGKQHGREEWVKFTFKRWFLMYNFAMSEKINSFWSFDSDTLIPSHLRDHEDKFKDYDCTEQCNGICMNGYIGNLKVVKGYLDKINELYQRPDYLKLQEQIVETNPTHAFTEMMAYDTFRNETSPRTIRLNSIINNEAFDDCICQSHDMEMQGDGKIKKLYVLDDGSIATHHIPSAKLVKAVTLNLSWVPAAFVVDLYFHSIKLLNKSI